MAHPITKKIYVATVTPFSAVYPFCEAPLFFALPASFVDIQRGRPNLVWVVRRLHAVTYARDGRNTLARTFS